MTLSDGTILEDRYRIDRLLGEGGMGAIYHGYDIKLAIQVALKENFLHSPEAIEQFQQEARILARLHHPNLPRVIDHFSFDSQQYLVMDYVEGKDLWEQFKARKHPLEEKAALDYIIQVCEAVSYLHQQNPPIIHRDIKPQNIKVTPDGRAVLVDFGIAKVADLDMRTRTGAQAITPGFSPPEQYGSMGTGPVSDIYALGATLYAVLTGQAPPDSISLMAGGAKFEAPNVINNRVSALVSAAIEHAMRVQQEDRPQTVTEWKAELEAIRAGTAVLPPETQVEEEDSTVVLDLDTQDLANAVLAGQTKPQPVAEPAIQQPAKSAPPWLWIGIAVIALIIAVGAIAFLIGQGSNNQNNSNQVDTQAILAALAATATQQAAIGGATPDIDLQSTLVALAATATAQTEAGAAQAQEVPADTPTPEPTATPIPPTDTPTPEPTATPQPATNTPTLEPTATSVPPTATPLPPTPVPERIAFISNRDGNRDIYTINLGGGDLKNLTQSPSTNEETPAWSPDGSKITFANHSVTENNILPNLTIRTMNDDGTGAALVTTQAGQPAWSPDGQQLAFATANNRLTIADADGRSGRPLTPGAGFNPNWSPDGKKLLFDNQTDLFVINSDGSELTQLTGPPADEIYGHWSPDGTQILFASNGDGNFEIYIMDANGGNGTRLTNNNADDTDPVWSPDGTQIAFASNRDGDWEIYIMNADGSGQTNITKHPANDEHPSWSP